MKNHAIFLGLLLIVESACHKNNNDNNEAVTASEIISATAENVNASTYTELATKTAALEAAIANFIDDASTTNLAQCKTLWKEARAAWEQSEGFLYGPVATENIDPRIDSWPVDFNAIENELSGTTDFSIETNMDALDDALKGFHPIEYILWGEDGEKEPSDFTAREKEYLLGLAKNLKKLTNQLAEQWNTNVSNAFILHFTSPSTQNPFYQSHKAVCEQMVNGMIDICEEVATGKIGEPYHLQDPSLEESPYSSNSMVDFKNNIISIQNAYLGKYNVDGKGLEELVRTYNLTLDAHIKTKINNALAALSTVTDPFGTALSTQQVQIQNSIDAIEELKDILESELLPFIQQKVTN